jgi:hypothetical protein
VSVRLPVWPGVPRNLLGRHRARSAAGASAAPGKPGACLTPPVRTGALRLAHTIRPSTDQREPLGRPHRACHERDRGLVPVPKADLEAV